MAKGLALTAAGVLAAGLTGCFGGAGAFICSTNNQCDARGGGKCEPDGLCSYADPNCTVAGQRYGENAGDNSNKCVGETGGGDGGMDGSSERCFGSSNGLLKPCFPSDPMGSITLPAAIDTDDSPLCSTTVTGVPAGLCVIAGSTILIDELVLVSGAKPLVLVATMTIDISATLDVASHRSLVAPYTSTQIGPGAELGPCNAAGSAGANGGGAGGSLGGLGGTGGRGGGTAGAATMVSSLRGGCPGQNGNSGTPGQGGHGGGAVYLIADTINITGGAINASGEGGHPGVTAGGGGGGGGSGGMIGLDAKVITNTGVVFANGASGGEGSGSTTMGNPGPEPNSVAAPSAPLSASGNGGDGGAGSGLGALNGLNGQTDTASGGGAGGGVGVIKIFDAMLTGQVSPPPS